MREEFQKLVELGRLDQTLVEPLVELTQKGFCHHKGWGFGQIKTVEVALGQFVIDFQGKPGHVMDLAFSAKSLKAIAPDHIMAKKAMNLAQVRQLAALNHLEVIKIVLNSFGGKATLDQIQGSLVPDVIQSDWKKWWETAKKEMKKDGHFQVPSKKTEPVIFEEREISLDQRASEDLKKAKGLKAKLIVATEVLKNIPDFQDAKAVASLTIQTLTADIGSHQRTMPALALEAIFLRDEIRELTGLQPDAGEVTATSVWSQVTKPATVLEVVSSPRLRAALNSYRDANPETWTDTVLGLLSFSSSKLCSECANLVIQCGKLDQLKNTLARLISQHAASSELLLWLARERSDAFADILGPEVFRAMLSAIERDQFNEKKSNKLGDFIISDQELLIELIGSADIEIIKDLTRALQLSPCFDDMDKRSLLARIVKTYPTVQSLITGDSKTKEDSSLLVSWSSLSRRKDEYQELVQKKIPANSKDIAIARSYGDLRENHEYKAAKETQRVLMRRKAELERELVRAKGIDYTASRTDVVSIGTRLNVTDLADGKKEVYSVVGAWDGDPDNNTISYLSPLGQAFLNKKPGESVDFGHDAIKRNFRVDSIEPLPVAETATVA